MKKIIASVLVFACFICCSLTFSSCSKTISGTYKREGVIIDTTYTFSGNEVTIVSSAGSLSRTTKATYVIERKDDDSMTITFTYAEGETPDGDLKGTMNFSEGTENGVKYIKIGSAQYYKQ